MKLRSMAVMMALGAALASPAHAEQKTDPFAQIDALLNSGLLLRGVVREEDVALLFEHIRAAVQASSEGRETPTPEALTRRAEEIAAEMKTRGSLAGLLLLNALEVATRQAVRDIFQAPAPR